MSAVHLFAAALLASSGVVQPAPATPKVASEQPSEADAMALARVYAPSDVRLEGEIRILRETFIPTMRKDEGLAALLDAFPALGPALVEAMVPHMSVYVEEFDARFFPEVAAIFRRSLSPEDVRLLTGFYTSPLGRKMVRTGAAKVDGSEMVAKALTEEGVQKSDIDRQALLAGFAIYGSLTEAERREFMTFAASPVGRRFLALRPQITEVGLKLLNEPGPKFKARTEAAMLDTITRVTGVDPRKVK